jgi:hypothetical protein
VFEGSLTGVVREDADIGTSVMTIKAHDGDKEHPRKIVYELVESELSVGYVIMCTRLLLFAQNALTRQRRRHLIPSHSVGRGPFKYYTR